jgi:hypothetical protein
VIQIHLYTTMSSSSSALPNSIDSDDSYQYPLMSVAKQKWYDAVECIHGCLHSPSGQIIDDKKIFSAVNIKSDFTHYYDASCIILIDVRQYLGFPDRSCKLRVRYEVSISLNEKDVSGGSIEMSIGIRKREGEDNDPVLSKGFNSRINMILDSITELHDPARVLMLCQSINALGEFHRAVS